MTKPSGSVTVVFWMSEVDRPSGSDSPPTGGFTSTVKPAGVSALATSGDVVIVGPKPKCSQPVNPVGLSLLSWNVKLFVTHFSGCLQVFARTVTACGPAHAVGRVKNGLSPPPTALQALASLTFWISPSLQPPLSALRQIRWLGSPGTAHSVIVNFTSCRCAILLVSVVIP